MKPPFYGWVLVGVGLLLQMVGTGSIVYAYSVIALPFQAEFGASRTMMMLGATVMPLAAALSSPLLGRLIDQRSLKLVMLFASLLLAAGFFLLSLATAMWQVPLTYALCMSMASLMLGPLGVSTLLSRWFQARLAFTMGIAALGTSIGGFLFPPLVGWLIEAQGWRDALRLLALLVVAITVPAALLIVNRPGDRGLLALGASPDGAQQAGPGEPPRVFRDRNFWLLTVILGLLFAAYSATLANLALFARESGVSEGRAALLISLVALGGMVGKVAFGFVADRVNLRLALGAALLLVILGLGLFLQGADTLLVAGCVALGLAAGGMLPVWGAMVAWLFGVSHYGRVMGLMNPFIMPLTVLAPLVTGILRDGTGSYNAAFNLFLVLLMIALGLLFGIRAPGGTAAGEPAEEGGVADGQA